MRKRLENREAATKTESEEVVSKAVMSWKLKQTRQDTNRHPLPLVVGSKKTKN